MAPKKAQKMSLNEFLGDNTLGSWADEMDNLPTAPAARSDDTGLGGLSRAPDRSGRDDFSRADRGPPREDLPLPTEPPFTAFIGNLAFDLTESELEEFFAPASIKSVKIIKDREDRPKGFGYIEFGDLDGLKDGLVKSGSNFAGRTIRVSVAEPPKERAGFGGSGGFDDEKFAGPWRRDGPLPDLPSREGSRRQYDSTGGPRGDREPLPPSVSDQTSDWRAASRGPVRGPSPPRFTKRSSFREDAPPSRADADDTWVRGAKFQPSAPPSEGPGSRLGSVRGKGDMGPPAPNPPEESDWRRPRAISRNSTSPSGSTPPTPQMGRRKLELLPRSGGPSAAPSPLASPNPAHTSSAPRSNPFGAAKPVDVTAREHEVELRLEKEREAVKERTTHTMSRTSSRQASHRGRTRDGVTPPASTVTSPTSPHAEQHKSLPRSATEASVRPSFSFASAAAGKKDAPAEVPEENDAVEDVADKLGEVTI